MSRRLLCCVFAVTLLATIPAASASDADTELIRRAAAGWRENRAAFPRVRCVYTMTVGRAATREDALAGKLTNTFSGRGMLAIDGELQRDSLEVDDAAVPKTTFEDPDGGGGIMTAPIGSHGFLTNGKLALVYPPMGPGGATLWPEEFAQLNGSPTPLDMGVMGAGGQQNPAVLIERHQQQGGAFEVADDVGLDGAPGVRITLRGDPAEEFSYTFDSRHGFLAVRHTFKLNGRLSTEMQVLGVKESPEQAWFPTESVVIDYPQQGDTPVYVRRFEVTELDYSPTEHDFEIVLAAGTILVNRGDANSQHTLSEALPTSAMALEDLAARTLRIAANRKAGRPVEYGLPQQPPGTNWWLIGAAALGGVVVAWLVLKWRALKRST